MSKILITGANSQVGKALTKLLGDTALPKTHEQLDVTDKEQVTEAIQSLRPSYVVNTAAVNDWAVTEGEPWDKPWVVNGTAVDHLVKASASVGAKFITFSSDAVFNGVRTNKMLNEEDAICPTTRFGTAKAAAEHAVLRIGQSTCPDYWSNDFRFWVIRTSTLFNSYDAPSKASLAHRILATANPSRPSLRIADNRLSFTYVPHLAKAVAYLIKNKADFLSGIYHVTNQDSGSCFQFAEHLSRGPVKFEVQPMTRLDAAISVKRRVDEMPRCVVLNNNKFIEDAGGPRLPTWQEAIEEFWSGFKKD